MAAPTVITLTSSNPLSASVPMTVTDTASQVTGVSVVVTGHLPGTVVITAQLPSALGGAVATATVRFIDQIIGGLAITNSSPTVLGQPTTLTASITSGTNVVYQWTFGDGVTTAFTTTNPITHIYPLTTTGLFTATVYAVNSEDDDFGPDTLVTIHNKPVILTMSPLPVPQDVTSTVTVTGTGSTFLAGAIVSITTSPTNTFVVSYTTTFINANRLTFQLNGLHFTNPGSFRLYVINPPMPPVAIRRSDPFEFTVQ